MISKCGEDCDRVVRSCSHVNVEHGTTLTFINYLLVEAGTSLFKKKRSHHCVM